MLVSDLAVLQRRPDLAVGYFHLNNATKESIELRAITSPDFGAIEIHETVMDGDIMRMRPRDSVRVAARDQIRFESGGLHLMLFEPKVKPGELFLLNFEFAAGIRIEMSARLEKGATGGVREHDVKGP